MENDLERLIVAAIRDYAAQYDSLKSAATSLGIKYETFRSWHDGKKSPTIKSLSPLADRLGLFQCESGQRPTIRRTAPNAPVESVTDKDSVAIKVYAMAGAGAGLDFEDADALAVINVPLAYARRSDCALLVKGDSMHGTIKSGGFVGVMRHNFEFVSGELYAICLPYEGMAIKRVIVDYATGEYIIRSDNPDREKYPDIRLPIAESPQIIIGRVVWIWQYV